MTKPKPKTGPSIRHTVLTELHRQNHTIYWLAKQMHPRTGVAIGSVYRMLGPGQYMHTLQVEAMLDILNLVIRPRRS